MLKKVDSADHKFQLKFSSKNRKREAGKSGDRKKQKRNENRRFTKSTEENVLYR